MENIEQKLKAVQDELMEYKTMQNVFERRVLDLQASLREKDDLISQLQENLARNCQGGMDNSGNRPGMVGAVKYERGDDDTEVTESEESRKIFVGGLNYDTTEQSLAAHFNVYGYILDCVVMRDQQRRSRGFGFVMYSKAFMVENALADKPHVIDGRRVDIKRAVPKEKGESSRVHREVVGGSSTDSEVLLKKLFVGGLNVETDEESLKNYFSKYGAVEDCCVMRDAERRSRRFGFVVFESVEMVDAAQQERPHIIDDRTVETKRAVPKGEDKSQQSGVKKIFIGGLKETTTPEIVREFFAQHGRVEEVECPKDRDQKRRGFAYIIFNDSDTVDKLVLMKHVTIDERRCEVKRAMSKYEIELKGGGRGRSMDQRSNGPGFNQGGTNFNQGGDGGGNWNQGGGGNWNQGGGGGGQNWNQGGGGGGPNWNQGGDNSRNWNQGGGGGGPNWNQGGAPAPNTNQGGQQNWNQGGGGAGGGGPNWNQGSGNCGPPTNQAGGGSGVGPNWGNQGGGSNWVGGGGGSGQNWNQNDQAPNQGQNWNQGNQWNAGRGNGTDKGGVGPMKSNSFSQRYSGPY